MNLLLISNSTNAGEPYLKYPIEEIKKTLAGVTEVVFIPYAAVTFSYDEYERKVQERFNEIGIKVSSVHHALNKRNFVRHAQAIVIGGGNTFALLKKMQEEDLLDTIFRRVKAGTPYVGWSAGSNVTCPTICTTNDMPIVQPSSFRAIGLVPFQINPHYLDANPEGHAGETREQRILEYLEANRSRYVVGLREGCMLRVTEDSIELIGKRPMRIFKKGMQTYEVNAGDDISFLIKRTK
ncbi:MAG: dipeptidase PepE [Alistipes sp.]|nr:dipeptidase PepE [Alistipes sp.]